MYLVYTNISVYNALYNILLIIRDTENRRKNKMWTSQRYWQHWPHKTQDEDNQNNTKKQRNIEN
jgi:hypothetical protein